MRITALTHIYPRDERDRRGVYIRQMYAKLGERHAIEVLVPRGADPGDIARRDGPVSVVPFPYLVPRGWSRFGQGGALTGDQKLTKASLALAPLYAMGAAREVRARSARTDLVHAHFLLPNGPLARAGNRRAPLVISLHGSDVYLAERSAMLARAARVAIRAAAAIVPCSDDLERRVIALGAPPEKVHVIPYGADPAIFSRVDPAARARIRAELGIGGKRMALFVGNLVPKKGITHLIAACPAIAAAHPEATVVIVGGGPLLEELKAQAAAARLKDGFLRFVGEKEWGEIPGWYAAADIALVPSVIDASGNVDGLPNVILESMAAGLPVIASRVAGIAMAVRHEETGLLVPPGDSSALAIAITRALSQPSEAKAWGDKGRQVLESELTWDRIAARYEAVFERATAPR